MRFFAIKPDGNIKWSYAYTGNNEITGAQIWSSPAIGADGTIYCAINPFPVANSILYAINPDGTLKWSYAFGDTIYSPPAIGADGIIYVGAHDGLYAINPDGTLKWSYATGGKTSSPAIGADGTIYVGAGSAETNYLYAFYSSSLGLANSPWPMFQHDLAHTGRSTAIPGHCGSSNGGTFASAPSTDLCSVGTASAVTNGGTTWNWTCAGSNGGATANCQANVANIQTWTVTPAPKTNGSMKPNTPQIVNNNATVSSPSVQTRATR